MIFFCLTPLLTRARADQPQPGRVLPGWEGAPPKLCERGLQGEPHERRVRVPGRFLYGGRQLRAVRSGIHVRQRGQAALPPAHVPAEHGEHLLHRLRGVEGRDRDLFGVRAQHAAHVVHARQVHAALGQLRALHPLPAGVPHAGRGGGRIGGGLLQVERALKSS